MEIRHCCLSKSLSQLCSCNCREYLWISVTHSCYMFHRTNSTSELFGSFGWRQSNTLIVCIQTASCSQVLHHNSYWLRSWDSAQHSPLRKGQDKLTPAVCDPAQLRLRALPPEPIQTFFLVITGFSSKQRRTCLTTDTGAGYWQGPHSSIHITMHSALQKCLKMYKWSLKHNLMQHLGGPINNTTYYVTNGLSSI